jgi:serine/threonine-protein kinase
MIGTTVSHYRILEKLGAGGMGEVYLAEDTKLHRKVALKFLPASLEKDAEARERLLREAQATSKLDHPNILTVHDVAQIDDRHFIVMAYIDGQPLTEYARAAAESLGDTLGLALQLAQGLEHAHRAGIVHRDLKPSNVMVDATGRVRILDFGLAKMQHAAKLTRTGSTLGTVAYASPEIAQGEEAGVASDIFSYGAVLYELLTGRLPFRGQHEAAIIYSIVHEEPPALAEVRPGAPSILQSTLDRCLAKDPRARYASCSELVADLKKAIKGLEATPAATDAATPSIAVLPLANLSADPENEYFSDGLTEELLNVLAKNPELRVTGRTSAFAFKGKSEDPRLIGQKLGVGTILEGSVRKAGNRVRITAQLIDAADGFHLWSETYDRVLDDIFAVQDDIARAVSSALNVTLLGERTKGKAVSSEAHNLVLQANHFAGQNSREGNAEAVRLYRKALELDPDYALAWAGLCGAYGNQGGFGHAELAEVVPLALAAGSKAIELDDKCVAAHINLGWCEFGFNFNWAEAERLFKRALALAPGDPDCLVASASINGAYGRLDEAIAVTQQALRIDPLNVNVHFHLGRFQWWAGKHDDAERTMRKLLALSADFASGRARLAQVLMDLGRGDEALREAQRETDPGYRGHALAIIHHARGDEAASDAALATLLGTDHWAFQIAEVYAVRGEADRAFEWLERGASLNDAGIPWARASTHLKNLHSDPRWPQFLKKIGLDT